MRLGLRKLGAASCHLGHNAAFPAGIVELSSLETAPHHRRKGIAGRLLDQLCAEADKSRTVLVLRADSEWLEAWYARYGFTPIQAVPVVLMARQPNLNAVRRQEPNGRRHRQAGDDALRDSR